VYPFVALARGRSCLRYEDLLRLADLLEGLHSNDGERRNV
jgi:hypothetical protein